jgi:acyl-CoA thioesterase I
MKKSLLAILILALALILYGFFKSADEEITNSASTGTTIVAFGDSLVAGVGAKTAGGFVGILSRELGVPILNLGVSGNTTTMAKERLDEVFEHDPKVVLLLLGGNDFLRGVPAEETFKNLEEMISLIQSHGSMVLLLGVRNGLFFDEHEARFKWIAEKWGTAYVPDVLSGVMGHPELMSDSLHPNEAGYRIIANRVKPILTELLK